jgi:hypothetical protein
MEIKFLEDYKVKKVRKFIPRDVWLCPAVATRNIRIFANYYSLNLFQLNNTYFYPKDNENKTRQFFPSNPLIQTFFYILGYKNVILGKAIL